MGTEKKGEKKKLAENLDEKKKHGFLLVTLRADSFFFLSSFGGKESEERGEAQRKRERERERERERG